MRNIVRIKRHPFGGDYLAINLFGFIYTLPPGLYGDG